MSCARSRAGGRSGWRGTRLAARPDRAQGVGYREPALLERFSEGNATLFAGVSATLEEAVDRLDVELPAPTIDEPGVVVHPHLFRSALG